MTDNFAIIRRTFSVPFSNVCQCEKCEAERNAPAALAAIEAELAEIKIKSWRYEEITRRALETTSAMEIERDALRENALALLAAENAALKKAVAAVSAEDMFDETDDPTDAADSRAIGDCKTAIRALMDKPSGETVAPDPTRAPDPEDAEQQKLVRDIVAPDYDHSMATGRYKANADAKVKEILTALRDALTVKLGW